MPATAPKLVVSAEHRRRIHQGDATAITEMVQEQLPQMWATAYPRIYRDSGQWPSPKLLAADLCGLVVKRQLSSEQIDIQDYMTAEHLAQYQVPTFFVSKDLLEAVRMTTPPQKLAWYDMHLPFEAAAFMLPHGGLAHPTEGPATWLAYARFRQGQRYPGKLVSGAEYVMLNGGMNLTGAVDRGPTDGGTMTMMQNFGLDNFPVIDLADLVSAAGGEDSTNVRLFGPMNDHDRHFVQQVLHLIFGFLLVMQERPQLVDRGTRTGKRTKHGQEVWTPNVLGRNYRIKRECPRLETAGDGSTPRMHWRRGHYREQPHGPQMSLRKHIWIEPVLVNAE